MEFIMESSKATLRLMSGLDFMVERLEPEDLGGDSMKGFRRHLQQAESSRFCLIAFSMNASLGQSSKLREVCKKKPEMIREAHDSADKLLPVLVGHTVEEGTVTFVLDMSKGGEYDDSAFLQAWEEDVASFLRKPAGRQTGAAADTHRQIRPWMKYFIAEGSVKSQLVELMSEEARDWAQNTAEGRIQLCMMGLVVIHLFQYGFQLLHESGAKITPSSIFHDLEEDEPQVENPKALLEKLRKDFPTVTMFPGEYYAAAYSKDSAYVKVMSAMSGIVHALCAGGEIHFNNVDADEVKSLHLANAGLVLQDSCAMVLAKGLVENQGVCQIKLPSSPSSSSNGVQSSLYSPADTIFAGSLQESQLSLEEKVQQVLLVCSGGELVGRDQLTKLFQEKKHPVCYDGFEPSGRMHLAQGIMKADIVNRLTKAGCVFMFWVADWFGLLNNKMGGDLAKIQTVGRYFVEVWKAAGMNMENVRFLWAAEEINKNSDRYWLLVMNIARAFTVSRMKRCCQIMGRQESDDMPAATIMYPCMQCADVFYLGADICQLGMDQRKVNVLAREFMDRKEFCHEKREKPIIASHGMVPGLLEGQEKMSKSNPDSAIFMEDSVEDVSRKIKKAFCPPNQVEGNPCVAYVRMIIFPRFGEFVLKRKAEHGGNIRFASVEEFETAYGAGSVHPGDLKASLAEAINEIIEPVRLHFRENPVAAQLLETVRRYQTTR